MEIYILGGGKRQSLRDFGIILILTLKLSTFVFFFLFLQNKKTKHSKLWIFSVQFNKVQQSAWKMHRWKLLTIPLCSFLGWWHHKRQKLFLTDFDIWSISYIWVSMCIHYGFFSDRFFVHIRHKIVNVILCMFWLIRLENIRINPHLDRFLCGRLHNFILFTFL